MAFLLLCRFGPASALGVSDGVKNRDAGLVALVVVGVVSLLLAGGALRV